MHLFAIDAQPGGSQLHGSSVSAGRAEKSEGGVGSGFRVPGSGFRFGVHG